MGIADGLQLLGLPGSFAPDAFETPRVVPVTILFRASLLLALFALPSCSSILAGGTSEVAGIAGAGIASSVTKSATAATAIGLGVAAGANAGLQYEERVVHRAEQAQIATAAGGLAPGATGPWRLTPCPSRRTSMVKSPLCACWARRQLTAWKLSFRLTQWPIMRRGGRSTPPRCARMG